MKIAEFAKLAQRFSWRTAVPGIAFFVGCILWMKLLSGSKAWFQWLPDTLVQYLRGLPAFPQKVWSIGIILFLFFVPPTLLFPLIRRWSSRMHRGGVMPCPHCAQPLTDSRMVIASQSCPHCRERVLDEPAQSVPILPEKDEQTLRAMSATEFNAAAKSYSGRVLVALGIMFGGLLGGAYFVRFFLPDPNADSPLFIVPAVISFGWMIQWTVRFERKRGLRCPCCRHDLTDSSQPVAATGNCPACGRGVLQSSKA